MQIRGGGMDEMWLSKRKENLIMRRILSCITGERIGSVIPVIGLFSQRGYNIESLTVAPTDDPTLSRMTIQTVGDEKAIEQIEKQLHKWWTCCGSANWVKAPTSNVKSCW